MTKTAISLKVKAAPDSLRDIFGSAEPKEGQSIPIAPGAELVHQHHMIRQGLIESGVIITAIVQITVGVTTKVVADWIGEKLKQKGTVQIDGKLVDAADHTAIQSALDDALKRSK